MQDFFYWMGVIYSGLFLLLGIGVFSGLVVNYFFSKMQDTHGLFKLASAMRDAREKK